MRSRRTQRYGSYFHLVSMVLTVVMSGGYFDKKSQEKVFAAIFDDNTLWSGFPLFILMNKSKESGFRSRTRLERKLDWELVRYVHPIPLNELYLCAVQRTILCRCEGSHESVAVA
ncbi:hypothetical protein EVAR_56002_1 [Eumeta japonica]|uniref:Uncharacterized protein n=1 Tax=Eumeta variegata TaxID=151549 RepID=A0A4C1YYW1_EUMVA|nr:hypothetical protein EVAR_56002_1 [Eumeta japonica]